MRAAIGCMRGHMPDQACVVLTAMACGRRGRGAARGRGWRTEEAASEEDASITARGNAEVCSVERFMIGAFNCPFQQHCFFIQYLGPRSGASLLSTATLMATLTARQREILEFIQRRVRESGYPPTREDIMEAFGFSSPTAARDHLLALAKKGCIELVPNSARGIRLLHEADNPAMRQLELPLIGRIAAGAPLTAAENAERWLRIDPELFSPRADFLHQIDGDSMLDLGIHPGDYVGIHAQSTASPGQIIAAVLPDRRTGEDRITLKRYQRRGDTVILQAENARAQYAPIEIDLRRDDPDTQERPAFRIAGLYVGLLRLSRP